MHLRNHENFKKIKHKNFTLGIFVWGVFVLWGFVWGVFVGGLCQGGFCPGGFCPRTLRDTSKYYNPKIQNVTITIEGKPNQLYSLGMRSFEQYDQARKYFAEGRLANETQA